MLSIANYAVLHSNGGIVGSNRCGGVKDRKERFNAEATRARRWGKCSNDSACRVSEWVFGGWNQRWIGKEDRNRALDFGNSLGLLLGRDI